MTETALSVDVYPTTDIAAIPTGSSTATAYIKVCYRPAHQHPDTRGSMIFDLSPYSGWTAESAVLNIDVFYKNGCGLPTTFHTYAATEMWDETSVRPYLTLTFPQALQATTWAGIKHPTF